MFAKAYPFTFTFGIQIELRFLPHIHPVFGPRKDELGPVSVLFYTGNTASPLQRGLV